MPSTPASIISVKNARTDLLSTPSKMVVFVVTRKPALTASRMASSAISYPPSLHTDRSWCSFSPSMWTEKVRYLLGCEKVQLLLEQQRVRAHVDVLLARHQAAHDLVDARVHQRFAAGNGHRRHAALIHRAEALFRRQFALENVTGILDLSAAGARQVAAIERLQHEHQRVALAPFQLLLEHVAGDGPHLRRGNRHKPYNTG